MWFGVQDEVVGKSGMTHKLCLKMVSNLNYCTWFVLIDASGVPQQEEVFAGCVKSSSLQIWDIFERMRRADETAAQPVREPALGARISATSWRPPMRHVTTDVLSLCEVWDSLPSFLTPCDNITSSDLSSWPIMSQRLQQHLTFQCMLWDFI